MTFEPLPPMPAPPSNDQRGTARDRGVAWAKRHKVGTGVIAFFLVALVMSPFTSSSAEDDEKTVAQESASAPKALEAPEAPKAVAAEPTSVPSSTPVPAPAAPAVAEPVQEEPAAPKPPTNRELAEKAASSVKGGVVMDHGKALEIQFPISENLTDGLTRAGIAMDTFKIMEALKKNGVEFKTVDIRGTFDMLDKYGQELPDQQVYKATFTNDVVNRIQYDNIAKTELDVLRTFTTTGFLALHSAFGYDQF